MKKTTNLLFIIIFCAHFALLTVFFIQNFNEIAYGKINLTRDKPLDIKNTNLIRDFDVNADEKADKITVLMYHRIIDEKDLMTNHYNEAGELHGTIVTLEQFEQQMKLLHDRNFHTLTLPEFQAFMEKDLDVPKNSVLITFDDGFKDNYVNGYDVLKKYGFNATIFLISGRIDKNPREYDPADAQFLSAEDISKSTDVFSYYGHTHDFHERDVNGEAFLTIKSEEEITKDLQRNFYIIGDTKAFSYPFGVYNKKTLDVLKQLDVEMAFTIKDGMAGPGDSILEIPRRGVYPGTTLDIFELLITYE